MQKINNYIVEKLKKINNNSEFINGETYYLIIGFAKQYDTICKKCNFLYVKFNKGIAGYIVTNLEDFKDKFRQRDIGRYFGLYKFKENKIKHIESVENLQKMCQENSYNLSEYVNQLIIKM